MTPSFTVGVVGGACAGSEIAHQLRQLGMEAIVFEQGSLPYGKIEDGLPRWHVKLQKKEKDKIDEKLSQEGIHFIPNCRFGEHVTLEQLQQDWQLPLVVMANGAWRDRALRVDGADKVQDHSLAYQNAFVYWFNHYPDANYQGTQFEIPPGPVVIGGGLASIDVAKICQYEMAKKAFAAQGVDLDAVSFDHYGIKKMADKHGVDQSTIQIQPAKLFYRKRIEDMPLVPLGDNPDAKKLEKAKLVRAKLVRNGYERYGFEVVPLSSPIQIHSENGSVTGVTFRKNRFANGGFEATEETFFVKTNLVISSIGSLPQSIPQIPMRGDLYDAESYHTGALTGLKGVYCVGNAITGRGNIKESFKNAARLGNVMGAYYDQTELNYEKWFKVETEQAREHVQVLFDYLQTLDPMSEAAVKHVRERVKSLQEARGYHLGYQTWREQILSER